MYNPPIIGIILDYQHDTINTSDRCYRARAHYANAVAESGGVPIFLPRCDIILENLYSLVNGIIITGSIYDIPPSFFNEVATSKYLSINNDKSAFDIKILDIIDDKKIPFLGICYGMQLLNIFYGGSMIQHIPDDIKSNINHQPQNNKYEPSHIITIKKDTILFGLSNNEEQVLVNSNHHQAINKLGRGLISSATTIDGVIEAIEPFNKEDSYKLGVEWHPEFLKSNPLDINIFKSLISAANQKLNNPHKEINL